MRRSMLLATFALALFALGTPALTEAQGGALGRLKKKAEEEVKRRAENQADRAVDKSLDNLENAIKCAVGDTECITRAEAGGKKVVLTDADGKPVNQNAKGGADAAASAPAGSGAPTLRPGEGAWANYDFVPGEKALRVTDFAGDVIGDFPRALEASDGNYEVVEWQGARWLRANGGNNRMLVPAGAPLPPRWTLEFEFLAEEGECWIFPTGQYSGSEAYFKFGARHNGALMRGDGRQAGTETLDGERKRGTPYTARVMVDGRYAKAYVNETRVVNVPNLDYERSENVLFYCDGTEERPVFIRNIRLAAGGRKLYDALTESGRVATQGIYFDTGSDRLRPESTPTLKEIGAMLTEHPELKLVIEGHTDNSGAAAANLTLSQQRAEAVRQHLIANGIAGTRLTAQGLGQTKPVAPNTTAEGKQQNRRVELVQVK
jgi:outer membrane protein OmpA-like peptidoglycan-associated protein